MPEIKSGMITIMGDSPRTRLLEFLMEFPKDMFTFSELAEGVGMSKSTITPQINELLILKMVKVVGKKRKSVYYQIDPTNIRIALIQKLISLRSMEVATEELKVDKKLQTIVNRAQKRSLEEHVKTLQGQIKTTRQVLKEITT